MNDNGSSGMTAIVAIIAIIVIVGLGYLVYQNTMATDTPNGGTNIDVTLPNGEIGE